MITFSIAVKMGMSRKSRVFTVILIMKNVSYINLLTEMFYASLEAVNPYMSVKTHVERIRSIYKDRNYSKLLTIGFGKASCLMAKAVEDNLMGFIDAGIIITKYGHCLYKPTKIKVYEAGHPVPDENGLRGTKEIINLLKSADEKTLIVCLISGGGSALLVSPYKGIALADKKKITELLLKTGADINEINTVRKHISKIKGGRLSEIAYPANIISLILSDVIGDRLDVIASGPTSPDRTTYDDALKILGKYGLINMSPKGIIGVLQKGTKGLIPETPKEGNGIFKDAENIIIGSNRIVLKAAKRKAEDLGFQAEILSSEITGEARKVGRQLAERAVEAKGSKCLISGGETTVTVKGEGAGGRSMELALAFAIEIEGIDGITLLSAGTDGTDGPTDAAGAIVDGETIKKARAIGLDPVEYLNNNDSYNFFKKTGDLFITGATGTNVMDIQIVSIK